MFVTTCVFSPLIFREQHDREHAEEVARKLKEVSQTNIFGSVISIDTNCHLFLYKINHVNLAMENDEQYIWILRTVGLSTNSSITRLLHVLT